MQARITLDGVRSVVQELFVPSANETPYVWLVIGLAHVLLAAAFAPLWYIVLPVYITKEIIDVYNGGRVPDSVVDTLFVCIGLLYSGPVWWPVLALTAGSVGACIRASR